MIILCIIYNINSVWSKYNSKIFSICHFPSYWLLLLNPNVCSPWITNQRTTFCQWLETIILDFKKNFVKTMDFKNYS